MAHATQEFPQRLAAILSFAKTHTPAPLWSFFGKYQPPSPTQEIAIQLRGLHRVRIANETAARQVQQIDDNIGRRLAADKLSATEVVELKHHPPHENAIVTFDNDAKVLAALVRHARDAEKASALGLAFAVWFRVEANHSKRDSQFIRQEIYSQIYQVFKSLDEQGLLNDRYALAFCQASLTINGDDRKKLSTLLACLQMTGFVASLLQASSDIEDIQIVLGFASFLISQDANYNDFSAVEFLGRLASLDGRTEVIRHLARIQRRSHEPIENLAPIFESFRFPMGLSVETVQAWGKVRDGKDLLGQIAKLARPCQKTRIPCLSPHAQTLSHYAEKTLQSLSLDVTEQISNEDNHKRWEVFLRGVAGIELNREKVRSGFISVVSNGDRLKLLLHQSRRPKLIRHIAGDGSDRDRWVLAKLLQAAGAMTPEDYSMCSICLGSGYLFDTVGSFCNRKTFRDFAAFIDRDIQNLRAFIDPKYAASIESESVGHVKRLMSFIREFLIDPQNAHYTNFEVYRTIPFSQK